MLNQKTLLLIAVCLGATKYLLVPLFEDYQALYQEYSSVDLRYQKSMSAISHTEEYQQKIAEYQRATKELSSAFGEPVNIDSYKIALQEQVSTILDSHGVELEKFGWSKELSHQVGDIYSGTLSLRLQGETSATILSLAKLEKITQVSKLEAFTATIRGYQREETDIGSATTNVDISIWVKAL